MKREIRMEAVNLTTVDGNVDRPTITIYKNDSPIIIMNTDELTVEEVNKIIDVVR